MAAFSSESFSNGNKKKRRNTFVWLIVLSASLIAAFAIAVSALGSGTVKRQRDALENALTRDITECYAEEGHYPRDLYYMMEHYGLRYNEDRFFVDYRVRGTNIRPEFTIITYGDED